MKKNILIANCGSIALGPSLVKMLKSSKNIDCNVIGIDANQKSAGSLLVDKFYKAPKSREKIYINFLKNLCAQEKIDIILSTSIEHVTIPFLKNKL